MQVSDLEEERRKLRLEVKFRAKYHGRAALEMGLSPEQLLLLEEYVEGLKGGRQPEERLVTQLQQRVSMRKYDCKHGATGVTGWCTAGACVTYMTTGHF
jgi:centrosomal protein CEP290